MKMTLHDRSAMEAFRRARGLDPDRVRRMRYALYQAHEPLPAALGRLGTEHMPALFSELDTQPLHLERQHDSQLDGSSKLVLRTADGLALETVLLRSATGRTTVCLSTQVGCAAGCPFCATARMGLRRHLTASEIVEQFLVAARIARQEDRRARNLVFMGMGEPLDNEQELHAAIELLLHRHGCHLPPRRILVSTVGIPAAMRRLVDRFPGIQLALSLHSARPDLRAKLVPWSRRHDWAELHETLTDLANRPRTHRHQGPFMIEYILLAGVNDSDSDAECLIRYLHGIPVHVNLIPYNRVSHAPDWQSTPRHDRDRFANILRQAGIFTTIRYSLGADIQAACGQLANTQQVS